MPAQDENISAGFQNVDRSDTDFLVRFLADANQFPSVVESFHTQLELLDIQQGDQVLDVGCGIGDRAAQMAAIAGPGGKVWGTDISSAMVEASKDRHGNSGLGVEFQVADARDQPFPDASFDCIRTERVLMYLNDPGEAFREFCRLLKDGGRLLAVDFDWDALSFAHKNKMLTRKLVEYISDSFPYGRIGADLFGFFTRAGFTDIVSKPLAYRCPLAFTKRVCGGVIQSGVDEGVFNDAEITDWWAALEEDERSGTYFMTFQGNIVKGTKA